MKVVVKCMSREFYSEGQGTIVGKIVNNYGGLTGHFRKSSCKKLRRNIIYIMNRSFKTNCKDWFDLMDIHNSFGDISIRTRELFDMNDNPIYDEYEREYWVNGFTDLTKVIERFFVIYINDKPINEKFLKKLMGISGIKKFSIQEKVMLNFLNREADWFA